MSVETRDALLHGQLMKVCDMKLSKHQQFLVHNLTKAFVSLPKVRRKGRQSYVREYNTGKNHG